MIGKMRILLSDLLLLFIVLVIDFPVCLFFSKQCSKDKSVCVIRLDNIGDFVLWLDSAKGLRELYHDRLLVLIVNEELYELANETGLWDEVWPISRKKMICNPLYRYRMLRKAKLRGFSVAIQPTFSREFILGDAFILATGANKRIGSIGDLSNIRAWQKSISDQWFTQLVPAKQEPLMELLRNAEFMRGLGYTSFLARCPRLLHSQQRKQKQYKLQKPYYVLFPGGSKALRKWPSSSFAQLADWLFDYTGFDGVLCGAVEDQAEAEWIQLNSKPILNDLTGRTSLNDLSDVIEGAVLLVSNDTSAVHIAAAVGTPAVCILGGGQYGRFLPYKLEQPCDSPLPIPVSYSMDCFGCNWRCNHNLSPEEPAPCIVNVNIESVIKVIKPLVDYDVIYGAN